MSRPRTLRSFLPLLLIPSLAPLGSADWPQYNGPDLTRTSAEKVSLREWPDDGPPQVWMIETPTGFSSFAVAKDLAFTLVAREIDGEPREACVALDAATGEEKWVADLGRAKYDRGGDSGASDNKGGDGPRSTPSVDDGRVYVFSSRMLLRCLDAKTGETIWSQDLVKEHDGEVMHWQSAASPLVDGDRVFVAGGGEGHTLLAFDKKTGEPLWGAEDEKLTHATPVVATIHGVRQVIFFMQSGLVSVESETGEVLWRGPFPFRTSTAASPVVLGDVVYCSAGYGVGAGAYRIVRKEGAFEAELLWQKRNELQNHWSTPVAHDGFVYGMFGFKEYGKAPLKCIDARTGEEKWSKSGFGPGNCILVGDLLIALSDTGEVVLVEARSDEYREVSRCDLLEGKCWSSPAFSDGQLYVRSTVEGGRFDLSGTGTR